MNKLKAVVAGMLLGAAGVASAADKPAIILVHGAFQDARCWSRVIPKLEAQGFKALAVELPGRGADKTPVAQITAEAYRDAVLKVIKQQKGRVVLVGHSAGGLTISRVAEAEPERIKALVYLAAYLPKNGDSLQSLSGVDKDSKLAQPGNFVVSPEGAYGSVAPAAVDAVFANGASPKDRSAIEASMLREPLAPGAAPVQLSADRFGKVDKYYVRTTRDAAVSPALQAQMLLATPVKQVYTIESGHAPYITNPDDVTKIIAEIAQK